MQEIFHTKLSHCSTFSRILKCLTSRIISNIGQPNSKGYSHNEESDSHFWDQMPCSCYQNTVEEFKLR
jgi:hypothetical protein